MKQTRRQFLIASGLALAGLATGCSVQKPTEPNPGTSTRILTSKSVVYPSSRSMYRNEGSAYDIIVDGYSKTPVGLLVYSPNDPDRQLSTEQTDQVNIKQFRVHLDYELGRLEAIIKENAQTIPAGLIDSRLNLYKGIDERHQEAEDYFATNPANLDNFSLPFNEIVYTAAGLIYGAEIWKAGLGKKSFVSIISSTEREANHDDVKQSFNLEGSANFNKPGEINGYDLIAIDSRDLNRDTFEEAVGSYLALPIN